MPAYQNREDARKRLHAIAESLKEDGGRSPEADGFKLMYLLGTTEMNVDEAIHAMETNERQAGAGDEPGRGKGFLDSVLDEMEDALKSHDLSDDSRLEEDTAWWGRVAGASADKLDEARKQRMRQESLRQQQIHRELMRASAISCLEIHDMVCGEFNPYRRLFGNFAGAQFEGLVDSLGDLAETVAEAVVDVVDDGITKVVGGKDEAEKDVSEKDGLEAEAAEVESPEKDVLKAAAEVAGKDASEAAEVESPEKDSAKPEAPYIPVHEDDFLHRNSDPEPVTEEELLRANENLLSPEEEEYRRLIGYDGLVKEEQEAMAAAHPEQAERAKRKTRAAERSAKTEKTAGDALEAEGAEIVRLSERAAAAGRPSAPDAAPPVMARPSDDTPPVLVRPEDKKLAGPRVMGPRK